MSSKGAGAVMREQDLQGRLVPKLRFPEFRDTGDWQTLTIGRISSVTTGKRDTQNKDGNGKYPFFVRSQTVERINSFSVDGEAILTSGDGVGVGKNFHYIVGKFDFHQRVYCIYRFEKNVSGQFVFQYFSTHFFDHVSRLSAKNSVDSVRMAMITEMPLQLPSFQEQQKVADCLSSIDALIAAEADKLEVLKNHKKGLMQQLFPAVGQTTPRFRFAEFRGADEWHETTLEKISPAIFDGTHQTPTYTESGVPFFSVENIVSGNKNKFISQDDHRLATIRNKPEFGDIIITRIGNIGFSKIIDWQGDFSIYVTLAIVKKSDIFESYFLHSYFQCNKYQTEILRKSLLNAVPCKINMDELRKTVVLLPSMPEQKAIAFCFLSIDAQIAAQSEKIDALNVHRKGLLQQLFPVVDEVQA